MRNDYFIIYNNADASEGIWQKLPAKRAQAWHNGNGKVGKRNLSYDTSHRAMKSRKGGQIERKMRHVVIAKGKPCIMHDA